MHVVFYVSLTCSQYPARHQLPPSGPGCGVGRSVSPLTLPNGIFRFSRHGWRFSPLVYTDGFHGVSSERLRAISRSTTAEDGDGKTTERHLELFTHYTCPSLPHLIALLCRPTASCVPKDTALVVVDALSALINHAFPKVPDPRTAGDLRGSRGLLTP